MTRRHTIVRICPDCGGILQSTAPEALTSTEVAASDASPPEGACQCLLCGYTETTDRRPAAGPA
jgi:hypothetical protein